MVSTCLLDSGIIIDALNGKRGRRELVDQLIQDGADMVCCSINITEVSPDCGRERRPKPSGFCEV